MNLSEAENSRQEKTHDFDDTYFATLCGGTGAIPIRL